MDSTMRNLRNLNTSSKYLRCGEYAFRVPINPYQHPKFDGNIQHLLAMLATLYNTCGGVIYLTMECSKSVGAEKIKQFKKRFLVMIKHNTGLPKHLFSFIETALLFERQRSWGALIVPCTTEGPLAGLQTDYCMNIDGDISPVQQTQDHIPDKRSSQNQQEFTLGETGTSARHHGGQSVSSSGGTPSSGQIEQPPTTDVSGATSPDSADKVDYSSYQTLDWTSNKKDWEKDLTVKEHQEIDEILASCNMLKPQLPMTVTPEREQLQYMFQSENDMNHVLATCNTGRNVRGFVIACKSWRSIVSNNKRVERPEGHICDILTVSEDGRIHFWVVIADVDETNSLQVMEYLMITGRMMKYRLVQNWCQGARQLFIRCGLSSPVAWTLTSAEAESEEMQNHLDRFTCNKSVNFKALQRALATVILSRESPLTRCVSDQASILLSAKQAEVLMHRGKVNYIQGSAGSGKSWIAVELYRMHGGDNSVYICTTETFLEFLRYNKVSGTLIHSHRDLITEIRTGTFDNKTCIIIDDSHNFSCSESSMEQLFRLLKDNREMALFVFADNDYQSFDRVRQKEMSKYIHALTCQVLGDEPVSTRLREIYRNTRKVVSFIQSAVQGIQDSHYEIECAHIENGDGIECIKMGDILVNTPENDLVEYLLSVLLTRHPPDIALFLDNSHLAEISQCRSLLGEQMPEIRFQSAADFPRTGIIVDSVDSFLGLDASLCIFIMHSASGQTKSGRSLANPRYRVFLASRATHKAVFVVAQIDAYLVQQMKFDRFTVGTPVAVTFVKGGYCLSISHVISMLKFAELALTSTREATVKA